MNFAPIICEWQSWSQGDVGLLITVSGLILAVALMIYARFYYGLPFVLAGALALYYGPPILNSWFGFAQSCATVQAQFAQEEGYANNTRICENNLFNTDAQTGEACSCNGASATPVCMTYYAACQANLPGYQGLANQCTCNQANAGQNPVPDCTTLTTTANLTQLVSGGNQLTLQQKGNNDCVTLSSGVGANLNLASNYNSCVNYSPSTGFSGCDNISGTAQVGYACAGNAGFCGSGNQITADPRPPGVACGCGVGGAAVGSTGACYPPSTQIADGGPVTYQNGTFSGGSINDYYLSSQGKQMKFSLTPNGKCLTETLNGTNYGEYCP